MSGSVVGRDCVVSTNAFVFTCVAIVGGDSLTAGGEAAGGVAAGDSSVPVDKTYAGCTEPAVVTGGVASGCVETCVVGVSGEMS